MPYYDTRTSAPQPLIGDDETALANAFDALYRLEVASTPKQREQAYAVRYRVYCEEFDHYESKDRFPDRLEHNPSDDNSIHLLIIRRVDGMAVATARLVLTDPNDATQPLPFEDACGDTLYPLAIPEGAAERRRIAELSRYAIIGSFRQQTGDLSPLERQVQSGMALVLGLFVHAVAQQAGIAALYGAMDARFAELSRRRGVRLTQIGQPTEFHGMRTPYGISLSSCPALFPELNRIAAAAAAAVRDPAYPPVITSPCLV